MGISYCLDVIPVFETLGGIDVGKLDVTIVEG
jgi:hypothetical protein